MKGNFATEIGLLIGRGKYAEKGDFQRGICNLYVLFQKQSYDLICALNLKFSSDRQNEITSVQESYLLMPSVKVRFVSVSKVF